MDETSKIIDIKSLCVFIQVFDIDTWCAIKYGPYMDGSNKIIFIKYQDYNLLHLLVDMNEYNYISSCSMPKKV